MMRDAVVIVGAGLMGGGIAARSALAGNKTVVVDTDSARGGRGGPRGGLHGRAGAKRPV